MHSGIDYWEARALLDWQVELGADEAILDAPIDRYSLTDEAPQPPAARRGAPVPGAAPATGPATATGPAPDAPRIDIPAEARRAAAAAPTLEALAAAMAAWPHCELRKGARNLVFADGDPAARVMIVGEAPGREEDLEGRPFVGRAGQLLDRMLAAIGLSRTAPDSGRGVYITNVVPWRPPGNRTPDSAEIAMMLPFLERHVALADPEVLVLMGNTPCQALLGRTGILRMRGHWTEALGRPALPMTHPAYLLRQTVAKREAWADLLSLSERLGR